VTVSEESLGRPVQCPACGSTFKAKQAEPEPSPPREDEGFRFTPLSPKEAELDQPLPDTPPDENEPPRRWGRQFHEAALRKIKAPANALLSAGIITCVLGVVLIIVQGVLLWLMSRQNDEFQGFVVGPMGPLANWQIIIAVAAILVQLVGIGLGVVIIRGARRMKKLKGYRQSMTCSILSMLTVFVVGCPLSSCSLLGMPFGMWAVAAGIWSIVVLCKPEVKEAFS
jgi:hypothetical protein